MKQHSVIFREIIPFLLMFVTLMVLTRLIDAMLHHFDLIWVGRYMGIPGSILIILSFVYSLRKRKIIRFGKPKTFLRMHQVLTLTGVLFVLVHAGVHVYTLLPWLALVAMLVNVISGMTGQFLLARSRRVIEEEKQAYIQQGLSSDVIEKKLFWNATAFKLMTKWRTIHLPITLIFASLTVIHIISIFLFWQWK